MNDALTRKKTGSRRRRHLKRIWNNVMMVMIAMVVFCTVYLLVLPAITLGDDPICGMTEHTHTDACYRTETVSSLCPAAGEVVLHSHSELCYDAHGELWCPLEERGEHLHGADCVKTEEVLVCLLDEIPAHTHGEECYREISALSCTLPEYPAHTHEDGCYMAETVLSCTVEESDEHAHDDACYTTAQTLICEAVEGEGHAHGDGCYTPAKELVCEVTETPGHTHDGSCYGLQEQLVCQLVQVTAHTHVDACMDENGSPVCGIVPAVEHVHEESCRRITALSQPELVCTVSGHTHADSCFPQQDTTQDGFLCGVGVHTHADTCYDENGTLTCTLAEHTHSEGCVVKDYDPNADLETAADWTASVEKVSLTGNWPKDILAIAESQLGYRESTRNVKLYEDGTVKGYTRYGAWYGVPYGDWCAMFVSFCVNYAGTEEVPQDSVCDSYIEKLQSAELYREAAGYLPKPGDIVFMDWNRADGVTTDVDHAGLVAEIIRDENGVPVQIKTLEGNADNKVQYQTYSADSPVLVGYGEVPMGAAMTCVCGLDAHTHSDACRDEAGNVVCGMEEHQHEDACYGRSLFYRDDALQAQLIIRNADQLPEDLTMTVTVVTEESNPNLYGAMSAALELRMEESAYFVGDAGFYRIELMSGGAEYTLPEGSTAVVDVTFTQPLFDAAAVADGRGLYTYLLEPGEPIMLFSGETIETFETQTITGERYENAAEGLTGLRLELGSSNDFAVLLATTTKTGTFWTRVTDKSELAAGNTYMIVSAEGNYALRGSTSNSSNYTAVMLEAVKGNTDYYTIRTRTGSVDNNVYWTLTASGSGFTVRNQASATYLAPSNSNWGDTVIATGSATVLFTYDDSVHCWRLYKAAASFWSSDNYLHNSGSGAFDVTTGADSSSYNVSEYYGQDMLIFKLSDKTELQVPEDVANKTAGSDSETGPEKPDYDPLIEPSDEKTGDTSLANPDNPELSVPGKYYSDKATSNIEKKFDLDNYALNQENDGKILTDKSVIYGDDDYDAFDSYPANTFGVTLSALAQEYEMPNEDVVRTPIDVVFVLDVSGSMTTNETTGSTTSRAKAMVDACNKAIKQIMADHPGNRVGMVLYATGAWKLLPLDRYVADNDLYLQINEITGPQQNYPSNPYTIHFVETAPSLKTESGTSYGNIGTGFNQGYGTYTQAGIALGYETFEAVTDTTYTAYFGSGDEQRAYTVTRQPVVILLSDGEPTHSTNLYMDPINGPHYGDGNGGKDNAKGVHGYNTILSANYFKRMIGIHYDLQPLFYTVGMGINTEEEGDGPHVSSSETGDNYKRAVLNPTKENIAALTSSTNGPTTTDQLKAMINGTFTDQAVSVLSNWPDPWTGIPHTMAPVLQVNPYADDYSYTDGAYFGELSGDDLADIFSKIVEDSLRSTPYGFILHKSSSIELTDRIGEGMEIKGAPVLRYAGVNYDPVEKTTENGVTTYIYRGTYTHPYLPEKVYDLEEIEVTVYYNENGHQVVSMYVPDTALPAYTPELTAKQFYYEALPVRLIYQVGLTAESEQQVRDLYKTGGTATFYTNVWEDGGEQSISNLYPSKDNPFYYKVQESTGETRYHAHHDLKPDGTNVTDTLEYIVDCSKVTETIDGDTFTKVVHKLGNNGKLVFEVPGVDIPVEKVWSSGIEPAEGTELELKIYNVQTSATGAEEATYVKSVILSAENGWKDVFEGMPILASGYYAVVENVPDGYLAQYSGETTTLVIDNKSVVVAKVDLSDTTNVPVTVVTNVLQVLLPNTGGMGTGIYYTFGVLLMAAALMYIAMNGRLRRKEGR